MKRNKKLKNKINKRIKEFEYVIENTDALSRSAIFTPMEMRDEISKLEGKVHSLYWVLYQLEPKNKTPNIKTSDYKGCNSYITDC